MAENYRPAYPEKSQNTADTASEQPTFGWNSNHPIGTCGHCGGEMVYNVPRLGSNGGYVHKSTGSLLCVADKLGPLVDTDQGPLL